jgi:hypothetical protein
MMNEDKSKGAVIEGTGVYTSIMVLSVLCTEVIVGAKLNLLGEGLGYYVVNEVGYLVFYWWLLRKIVHKVIDVTYNKLTEGKELTKFKTHDCLKLRDDLTLKYYSYTVSVLFIFSVIKMIVVFK